MGVRGKTFFELPFGRFTHVDWTPRVTLDTIYDLASLTKPLVTALCVLTLTERGMIVLDDSLGNFFDDRVRGEKRKITLAQLLNHSAGFPAWLPLYERVVKVPLNKRKEFLLGLLLDDIPLQNAPGIEHVYSDVGFMLLGLVLERVAQMSLNELCESFVFEPLGIKGLFFLPLEDKSRQKGLSLNPIVPSGYCPWRKKVLMGEVHDENAWAMGGVAGHAGLFGTVHGVARLIETLLEIYKGRSERPFFRKEGLARFWRRTGARDSTWALGFDTPSSTASTAGQYYSPESVGHLGFTGTSFWLDLEKEVCTVFLSNRTFPHVTEEKNRAMKEFRSRLHDLIMLSLGKQL